jgi:Lrp/AsnC family transcriptional regulator, regulator for asnA, asnC and gidA
MWEFMKLEEIDKKILNTVIENSRLSLRQIAKKVRVSVATVMNHLKKLENEKVIKKYTVQIDYEKIGFDVEVIIEIKISNGMLFDVENKIASNPHVFMIYDLTGETDAILMARFHSRRQMDNFLKKLQTYKFVERTETKLILNTIKDSTSYLQ